MVKKPETIGEHHFFRYNSDWNIPVDSIGVFEKFLKTQNYQLIVEYFDEGKIPVLSFVDRENKIVELGISNNHDEKIIRLAVAQCYGHFIYRDKRKIPFSYGLCVPSYALTSTIVKYEDIDNTERLAEIFGVPDYVIEKRLIDLEIFPPWYPVLKDENIDRENDNNVL